MLKLSIRYFKRLSLTCKTVSIFKICFLSLNLSYIHAELISKKHTSKHQRHLYSLFTLKYQIYCKPCFQQFSKMASLRLLCGIWTLHLYTRTTIIKPSFVSSFWDHSSTAMSTSHFYVVNLFLLLFR